MDGNCPDCGLCHAAGRIFTQNSWIHISLGIRLITGIISILGLILLTVAIKRAKSLHFNARILLLVMTISTVLSVFGIAIAALYKFYISYILPEEERCEYQVFKQIPLFAFRALYWIGGQGLVASTIMLAIERSIATKNFKTYELQQRKWLGKLLSILIIIFMGIQTACMPYPRNLPYYSPELDNTHKTRLTASALYLIYALALLVFIALWLMNLRHKKNHISSQLSARYQLNENIATTFLMIPLVLVVALLTTMWQIGCLVFLPNIDRHSVASEELFQDVVRFAHYDEFQITIIPFLTILLIILLPVFSLNIRRPLLNICGLESCSTRRSSVAVKNPKDEAAIYFRNLQAQWKNPTSI